MAKEFKKILMANSNEVSLCSKYNSGANKQTEFEIIKDKESNTTNIKPSIELMVKMIDMYVEEKAEKYDEYNAFKDFLNYWLEYDVNNCYYNLLNEALRSALLEIQYTEELTKEEKEDKYRQVFDMFIQEYKNMPITKTQDGKYEVSLVSNSHIQEVEANPQNETSDITKESKNQMKDAEKLNVIEKITELLKSAIGLEKTETPAEEQPEVQQDAVEEQAPVEETAEQAEVEPPVVEEEVTEEPTEEGEPEVEEKEEKPTEEGEPEGEQPEETVEEETELQKVINAKLEVEKELAELKKVNEEKEIQMEKMQFIQKAKDEYSMLVGKPEEIAETLYAISKSSLSEETQQFILEQFKKVSNSNQELTEEVGFINKNADHNTSEEDKIYAKAEEIAKAKNISIKKALREVI